MITQFSAWLTYFSTLIFVFLGIFIGVILAFIAPEELKVGRKYFRGMMDAIYGFVFGLLLYYYNVDVFLCIFLGLAIALLVYFMPRWRWVDPVSYYLLGLLFLLSTKVTDLFIVNSALIFLYGLPLGSRYVEENPTKGRTTLLSDVFLTYGAFLIVALVANLFALYVTRLM